MNLKNKKHLIQSIFVVSFFEDDGTQNYLVFQTAYTPFKTVSINDSNILLWKSKDCLMKVLSFLLHIIKYLILQ